MLLTIWHSSTQVQSVTEGSPAPITTLHCLTYLTGSITVLATQVCPMLEWQVLTTSNITEAIDLAFVDCADIKAYIGPPSVRARYEMLRSCLSELVRASILAPIPPLHSWLELLRVRNNNLTSGISPHDRRYSLYKVWWGGSGFAVT